MVSIYIHQLEITDKLKHFSSEEINVVLNISEITLKRILSTFPKVNYFKKHKGNADVYKQVPIQAYFGKNADKTGFVEVDYVEHSGGNGSGIFCITGDYVDVCLQWIARSAGLGKNEASIRSIHEKNLEKIYHKIYEYHPDNCKTILKILLEKATGNYDVSRSRPYKKDDNAHVEQKNGDKVRKLVGYHRYDTEKQIKILNELYEVEDLITNFFTASQKLKEIIKDEKGRVIKKIHEKAKTPYQRLMESKIDKKIKKKLTKLFKQLNLVELRERSDKLRDKLSHSIR